MHLEFMLAPILYVKVYYCTLAILTIYCIFLYSQFPERRVLYCNRQGNIIPALVLTLLLSLFIGLRPLSGVFVDMMNYDEHYKFLGNTRPLNFEYDSETNNLIFDNLFSFLATNLYEITIFFAIIASIYYFGMFFALRKIFPHDLFYALLICAGAFSSFNYAVNGIKAGAACSIFLLAFAYYRKPLIAALFCLISLGFHHSMTLPIAAFILSYFIKDAKWFFGFWILCLFLSTLHIQGLSDLLATLTDERGQTYLTAEAEEWGYKGGFRWDFIFYSIPPIAIGYWMLYKKHVTDKLYHIMLCSYLTVNGIWLLCMYVPFNNRIAYLSWFILPVIIVYPFFKFKLRTRQYIQANYVVGIYLLFTLFSVFFM